MTTTEKIALVDRIKELRRALPHLECDTRELHDDDDAIALAGARVTAARTELNLKLLEYFELTERQNGD